MIHSIENDELCVRVKEFGAELTSLYCKSNHTEYLWQGDPAVWSGQSPILFPIIGRLKNDLYTIGGKEFSMPKHGLARKRPFCVTEQKENTMTFTQTDDENTLLQYPFHYRLSVRFSLSGRKLTVAHIVENINNQDMYFSIGAHPAFTCQIGDVLSFEQKETLQTQMLDLKESLRLPEKKPVLDNARDIVITADLFDKDSLIFTGYRSKSLTLHADGGKRNIHFCFESPYLGIWAKPGAPYVCLEPWCGVNDAWNSDGIFEKKEGIICLPAGKTYTMTWSAEL